MRLTLVMLSFLSISSFQINKIPIHSLKSPKMLTNPVQILKNVNEIGSEWTYNEFINSINNKNIESVTFLDNNNYAIIDKMNDISELTKENIHLFKGIPELTDNIINLLIKNNINFDIYQNLQNNNQFSALQFGLQFIFGVGAISGPILCSIFMEWFGLNGLFIFLIISHAIIGIFGLYRMKVRDTVENPDSTFTPVPATITPAGLELDPDTPATLEENTVIETVKP